MDRLATTTAANRGGGVNNQHLNFNMVSGIGQFHTNERDKPNATPYLAIGFEGIRALVDNPQQVDKAQAQWLIPSTLPSRNFKNQEQNGLFLMLWADLDATPPDQDTVGDIIDSMTGGVDFEIYSSRSATAENMKCRVLIPLAKSLSGTDWMLTQSILNDKLQAEGVIPDRANERAAQLCYLPNRGAFYESTYDRNGQFFDPLTAWAAEIAAKRETLEAERVAVETAKQAAAAKRATLDMSGTPDLITAFNMVYTVEEWLTTAGYDQRGNSFRHPESESGSYSATVKDGRVNALSPNDPLYSNGTGAHDPFSVFTVLFHGGDRNAAMKDAGDRLLTIDGMGWNNAKQTEWAKNRSQDPAAAFGQSNTTSTANTSIPFSLAKFSLNGRSKTMEKNMLAEVYIMGKIAILGQITVIYAKPNTGKTLITMRLLIDSIGLKRINCEDVFYINADDNYRGLCEKIKLAEKYGFHMLAPGHFNFESKDFIEHIQAMVNQDSAKGIIIILDTLKKFTDLMDKKLASDFMRVARAFVSHGGSLILLAHTNKNRSGEGKVIAGGTSDIIDDADCAYTLDEISNNNSLKSVLFENLKARGDVVNEAGYTYSIANGQTYEDRLNSVVSLDAESAEQAKRTKAVEAKREKDQPIIDAILEELKTDSQIKTDLVTNVMKDSGISRRAIVKILDDYTGRDWCLVPGDKNSKLYKASPEFNGKW